MYGQGSSIIYSFSLFPYLRAPSPLMVSLAGSIRKVPGCSHANYMLQACTTEIDKQIPSWTVQDEYTYNPRSFLKVSRPCSPDS
jgi:hypothetical protein